MQEIHQASKRLGSVGTRSRKDSHSEIDAPSESRSRAWSSDRLPSILSVASVIIFFIVWELIARAELINRIFLPAPTSMWEALQRMADDGSLWSNGRYSLENFVIGVGLGSIVGIVVGLPAGSSRVFRRLISPYVWSMSSLPRVAWLPLLILILGFSDATKLTLIFISAVFPMLINCMAGGRTVDTSLMTAGRVFGVGGVRLYKTIVLPHTLPFIVSGFKLGATRALAAVLVSEMFGGSQGLGVLIVLAGQRFDTASVFALLFILVVLALMIVQAVDHLERRIAPWSTQVNI